MLDIVIVDDEKLARDRLKRMVEALGYEVSAEAENGEQALEVIMSVPSKAKAIKLDNPAQVKSNQQPETELHALGGNN